MRGRTLFTVGVLAVAVAGCGGSSHQPQAAAGTPRGTPSATASPSAVPSVASAALGTPYPAAIRTAFCGEFTAAIGRPPAGRTKQQVCGCVLQRLAGQYTIQQFLASVTAFETPGTPQRRTIDTDTALCLRG